VSANGGATSPGPCETCPLQGGWSRTGRGAPRSWRSAARASARASPSMRPATTSQVCEPVPEHCCSVRGLPALLGWRDPTQPLSSAGHPMSPGWWRGSPSCSASAERW